MIVLIRCYVICMMHNLSENVLIPKIMCFLVTNVIKAVKIKLIFPSLKMVKYHLFRQENSIIHWKA
jgi:hypothetical protein